MTLKERILEALRTAPGLTDRELTDQLHGREAPAQPINQATHQLASVRLIVRRERSDGLLGNYIAGNMHAAGEGATASDSNRRRDDWPTGNRSGRARPKELDESDIERHVRAYLDKRDPGSRYSSFDYCFNHFQSYRERGQLPDLTRGDLLENSCLHLGFYLASWGMFRGRADLLRRSARHYVPVIHALVDMPAELWEMDVHQYDDGRCPLIFEGAHRIRRALSNVATDVLVTKIMLGTFGCVPAFDRYFKTGLRAATFGPKALRRIGQFYVRQADLIERNRVPTLDFSSGAPTTRRYTRAKVIDMIFFVAGGAD